MHFFIVELTRALKEKRFYIITFFLIGMSLIVTFPTYLPKQIDYWYSAGNEIKSFTSIDVWKMFLNCRLMTAFIVLFPILIYSHSIIDDLNYKYINNIILKVNFKVYFRAKLLVCMFLGGLTYCVTSLASFGLYNIIYSGQTLDINSVQYTFLLFGYEINFGSPVSYVIFISIILFVLGAIYSSIGFLIGLYTENKMLVYSISALSLHIYEGTIYAISRLCKLIIGERASSLYMSFSVFAELGVYATHTVIFNNLVLFIIILYVMSIKLKKIENSLLGN